VNGTVRAVSFRRPRRQPAATGAAAKAAVRARTIAYVLTGVYAAVFVGVAVLHFEAFGSARADLGYMTQAVWSTAHGHFLEATSLSGRETTRLAAHVDPFLLLFVPLLSIWSSPLLLVVFQALAVASGALPVFWLARKHLGSERAAAHFVVAYLFYPATQFNAFTISSGFHSVSIAVPLILYAIWFLDEERLGLFAVFAVLAISTKEEMGAAVGSLGIWYAVRKGRRLAGCTIFMLGLTISLVDFVYVIPHFSPSGIDPFAARYAEVGTTPGGIAHTALHDPGAFLSAIATTHKLLYVVLLFAPFLGLWILEPLLFLGALPDLAINLLSSKSDQTVIGYHWTAGIVPFTVAASIFGAKKLRRGADEVSLWALVGVLVISLYSPLLLAKKDPAIVLGHDPARAAKARALALVPAGVPVTASNQLGAYLSTRRYVYTFPVERRADWAIVDAHDQTYADESGFERALRKLEASSRWSRVYSANGVEVFRRSSPPMVRFGLADPSVHAEGRRRIVSPWRQWSTISAR
jgi:uncharacterized membrane protein